jgi:hypothetical protein
VGVASGAVAVAAAGAATGLYLTTSSDFDHLRDTCAPRCAQADADSIDQRALATNVLIGVAGAAAAFAVVSFAVDLAAPRERARVGASALPLPGGGGAATIWGSF